MPKKTIRIRVAVNYNDYLTIGEAAKLLGVCITTLRNWDRKGKLKAYRHSISAYRLYKLVDINALAEKTRKGE